MLFKLHSISLIERVCSVILSTQDFSLCSVNVASNLAAVFSTQKKFCWKFVGMNMKGGVGKSGDG